MPDFREGDVVSFAVAAEIVKFLGDDFVEVKDEDGHGHEVPLRALRAAFPNVVERFERKRALRQPSWPPTSRVIAPEIRERNRDGPRRPERGQHYDERREREQRREAKRRGY